MKIRMKSSASLVAIAAGSTASQYQTDHCHHDAVLLDLKVGLFPPTNVEEVYAER